MSPEGDELNSKGRRVSVERKRGRVILARREIFNFAIMWQATGRLSHKFRIVVTPVTVCDILFRIKNYDVETSEKLLVNFLCE